MERDDDRSGGGTPVKLDFDRDDIVDGFVGETPIVEDNEPDANVTDFLQSVIHNHVLRAAIDRLESRETFKQVFEKRVETFSALVADYVTASKFSQSTKLSDHSILSDEDLVSQLIALTGDIRGGFEVLERAAQSLGKHWEADTRNFLEVTIGMSRLQLLMRKLVERIQQNTALKFVGTALIAVPAGEEHTFGQCMLDEILRAHGWRTVMVNPDKPGELAKRVKKEAANLVCLSWLSSHLEEAVNEDISVFQRLPLNERPILIAGGLASQRKDKWMVSHGVDQVCDNAYSAITIASQLVDILENNAKSSRGRSVSELFGGRV
ncbi:MAG: hypothetical protein AAF940_08215 [Pseudomonadota bacterium]